jgi:hypothetical protein
VWTEISNWSQIQTFHPDSWDVTRDMVDWFGNLSGAPRQTAAVTKGAQSLSILVCWTVWKERNTRIFQGAENAPTLMVETIKCEAMGKGWE